ncbi:MAG: hypothetical protein R3F13_14695 [Prosthecobacter sp.]
MSDSFSIRHPVIAAVNGLTTWWRIVSFSAVLMLTACSQPAYLGDYEDIPVGSRVEFWVDHDDHGWVASNIHIACLPRPMSGAEARCWAEGVADRDAGIKWTRYYILSTPPEPARPRRTRVHTIGGKRLY